MITEEEYRQYDREIDEYIDKCIKDNIKHHNNVLLYYRDTEKWKNDLEIKALKCSIYMLSKGVNESYYYLKNPEEAIRKKLHIDKFENLYDEILEELKTLKYVEKVFYSSPYIRRQYVDDDTDIEDIRKKIDKLEQRLEHVERGMNASDDYYKVKRVMQMYRQNYALSVQGLENCQKRLKEIENNR